MTGDQFKALGLTLNEQEWRSLREGLNPMLLGLDYATVLEDLSAALERQAVRPVAPLGNVELAIKLHETEAAAEAARVDLRREQERTKKLERDLSITRDKLEAARQSWGAASSRIANEGDRVELRQLREQLEELKRSNEELEERARLATQLENATNHEIAIRQKRIDEQLIDLNANIHGDVILSDRERDDELSKLDRELTQARIEGNRLGGEIGELRALLTERTTQRDAYRDQLGKLDMERLERFEKFYRGPELDADILSPPGEGVKVGRGPLKVPELTSEQAQTAAQYSELLAKLGQGGGAVVAIDTFEESEAGLEAMDATLAEVTARAAKLREQRADLNAKLRRAEKTCSKAECAGKATRECEVCHVAGCCAHIVQKRRGKLLCPVCARAGGEEATV